MFVVKKQIKINNKTIEYTLKVSRRAGRIRLTIYREGRLTVTLPRGVSENFAKKFIIRKSRWVIRKLEYFKRFPTLVTHTKRDYIRYKNQAQTLAEERIAFFKTVYPYPVNVIRIRNQKTRWGSCSKKGNLTFNFKIVLLPQRQSDYVIVHELCHVKEFNHSPQFWNLVAKTIPDHQAIRKELRQRAIGPR